MCWRSFTMDYDEVIDVRGLAYRLCAEFGRADDAATMDALRGPMNLAYGHRRKLSGATRTMPHTFGDMDCQPAGSPPAGRERPIPTRREWHRPKSPAGRCC